MTRISINNEVLAIGESDTAADIERAFRKFQDVQVLLNVGDILSERISELKERNADLSFKVQENKNDGYSFVPRFGVFNESLALPLEKLFFNSKPFKGYFKPMFYRRCFMHLKTFVNLRFKR